MTQAPTTVAPTVLRDARWSDLPELAALEGEVFPEDAWSQRSWWAELAGRPRRDYVVVTAGEAGPVLGYGGLDHGGEVADVMTVVVAPAGRGRGIGRRLLTELEARARRRGAAHLVLEVRADNDPALGLYRAAGFVHISTRRRYYQPGDVDALVLRKALGENDPRKESKDA